MEFNTIINHKPCDGWYAGDYKLDNIVIYDETGREYTYNVYDLSTVKDGKYSQIKVFAFNFEVKRYLKKNISKRQPFLLKAGTDFMSKSIYNLYIPAELVNYKYVGHKDNTTDDGYTWHNDNYQFVVYVYNPKGLPAYKQKAITLTTAWCEKTDGLKRLEKLAKEINDCSYGLDITSSQLKEILKKFNITPKENTNGLE